MEKINVKELNDNVFETIGKEWMLVCAGNKDKFNMMTASWGCLGWLWNKPVAVVFIRPERFTHGIIEENEFMTLSFLGNSEEARKIYSFCGSKSGRDLDKAKETGLIPVETDNGSIAFDQSRLTLECRKLYKDNMTAEKFLDKDLLQWYGAKGGFHDVYVVETDKKAVAAFYDRGYIAEKLKGLETELSLECRITLDGEERWVRNVVIRGEIEDSEYDKKFLGKELLVDWRQTGAELCCKGFCFRTCGGDA